MKKNLTFQKKMEKIKRKIKQRIMKSKKNQKIGDIQITQQKIKILIYIKN